MPVDVEHDAVRPLLGAGAGVAVVHLRARGAGHVEEGGVELRPPGHDARRARRPRGSGKVTSCPDGDRTTTSSTRLPRRHRGRVEAEVLEQPQGAGGEAVAAELVPREGGLVDEHDVAAVRGPGVIAAAAPAGPPPTTATSALLHQPTAMTSSKPSARHAWKASGSVTAAGSMLIPMHTSSS